MSIGSSNFFCLSGKMEAYSFLRHTLITTHCIGYFTVVRIKTRYNFYMKDVSDLLLMTNFHFKKHPESVLL